MDRKVKDRTDLNYKQIKKQMRQGLAAAVFIVLGTVLFLLLVTRKADEVRSVNRIFVQMRDLEEKRKQTENLLVRYESKENQIQKLFPNERTIAEFVEQIEQAASLSSNSVDFAFETSKPRKDNNNYSILSYRLKLTTDLNGFLVFLDRFEQLPYMSSIQLIQVLNLDNISAAGDYVIKANIYVAEPFSI